MNKIDNLIFEEMEKLIKELKHDDIIDLFKTQRATRFYNHGDHVDYMQKKADKFPSFESFKNGMFKFKHESSGEWLKTSERTYDVYIKFLTWPEVVNLVQNDKSSKEITDFLYNGDLGVFCTCPSFWYHYSYAASQKGAGTYLQKIPSPITNPTLQGIGCKHLDACMSKRVLKFLYSTVRKEAEKHQKSVAKKALDKKK
jgi:hypothetical protein